MIDLTTSVPTYGLTSIFPEPPIDTLLALPPPTELGGNKIKTIPKEGPILNVEQAFTLRAAAIDACNLIVETARRLGDEEISTRAADTDLLWLKSITVPEVDAWVWAVAKDRVDYRQLERFVLRNTPYF